VLIAFWGLSVRAIGELAINMIQMNSEHPTINHVSLSTADCEIEKYELNLCPLKTRNLDFLYKQ